MTDEDKRASPDKVWDERRLRIATDAGGIALWSWNVDTDRITLDERAFEIWGLPQNDEITFEQLSACVLPADLDKVKEAFNATRDLRGEYELDFRILHGDEVRWVSARGRGDDQGMIDRIMYGVFIDVTSRKIAEESRDMVTGEMHHRIKNLFSVSSALASIASRSSETKEAMLEDLTRRLRGLSAAHDLLFAGFHDIQQEVNLEELLMALLNAYSAGSSNSRSVAISVPKVMVRERAVTSLAMIIHELATNSAKYGALSAQSGRLVLTCHEAGDDVELVWAESGVVAHEIESHGSGFGSLLTDRVIKQVGGSIARNWTKDGLIVTLRMSKKRLIA